MELNDRKKQILKSIIDAYIESGEPIGSKYLTSNTGITLSPATVRNEMSELEEMGYLDKPHTSAGRVPSSSAYRLYVDELMGNYRLTVEELSVINELARFKMSELDKIISNAGKVMSEMTGCVTLSFTKEQNDSTILRFDTVEVDEQSFLLVIISHDRKARTEHIRTDMFLSESDLLKIKKILNENLTEIPIEKVTMPLIMKMESEAGILSPLINPIIRVAFKCFEPENDGSIKINGISNLLEYPEFSNLSKLRSIMDVFDKQKGYIKNLLTSPDQKPDDPVEPAGKLVPINADGMKIYIGDEKSSSALSDTSVVYCSVPCGSSEAVIGILGPKRMDYKKVVSTLKQFTQSIEEAMEKEKEKHNPEET